MNKITFIGAGSMAEAMMAGMVSNSMLESSHIWVTNRTNDTKLKALKDSYRINTTYDLHDLLADAEVVILAMKPKDAAVALKQIKGHLTENMLLVSVLAGISIDTIQALIEKPIAIVRAMPNTSAAVGQSATAMATNEHVTSKQLRMATAIFQTIGQTTIVKEQQLDAVTGLSGSGPAYIYYLVEAMEKSAVEIGLEKEMAKELIVQTLLGAASMLKQSSKEPRQMRREVTSPGGTTEAGIHVLEQHGVQEAFVKCIQEATSQSKRLGMLLTEEIKGSAEYSQM
ncbi:pyrroline-5-carboxylate reductase [Cytobacillus spongiae]|uniref:pyrroline-5-carboxylate reductase n=1 Tax=Cytobacillus spongiae TaxID=2901381 RepID=UPI001F42F945|nr:pyrroline-5-carboxylate reductase [Cytobacillus spongiae]UII54741.1 pyrroline-5-carboxylate reductase [Cytobacillus spongiae]